jgi:hypothetical protein
MSQGIYPKTLKSIILNSTLSLAFKCSGRILAKGQGLLRMIVSFFKFNTPFPPFIGSLTTSGSNMNLIITCEVLEGDYVHSIIELVGFLMMMNSTT